MADEEKESGGSVKEIWKDLKLQLHERLSSPLIGSFVISWLIWNHRLLVVLLSSKPVEERFKFVDEILYPNNWVILWKGVSAPLVFSLLYIYLYPLIAKLINRTWVKRQVEIKEESDRIQAGRLLTEEEGRKILEDARRMRSEAREEVRKLGQELEQIRPRKVGESPEKEPDPVHDSNAPVIEKLRRKIDELETKMDRDVYHKFEEIFPEMFGSEPKLSKDATELLVAAAKAPIGIRRMKLDTGTLLEAGARTFASGTDEIAAARWIDALNELIKADLLFQEGPYFKLTKRGLRIAHSLIK